MFLYIILNRLMKEKSDEDLMAITFHNHNYSEYTMNSPPLMKLKQDEKQNTELPRIASKTKNACLNVLLHNN